MATPSGTISFQDVEDEFGGSHPIAMSEFNGFIDQAATATISMSQMQGLSAIVPLTYTHQWTGYRHNTGGSYNYSSLINGGSIQSGDLILFQCVAFSSDTTPTGFTNLSKGYANYSVVYYNTSYRIATSAETSVSGYASNTATISVSVYRPSAAINVVTPYISTSTSTSGTITSSNADTNHIYFVHTFHDNEETLSLTSNDGNVNSNNGWGSGSVTLNAMVGHDDSGGSYSNKSWSIPNGVSQVVYGYIELSG